MLSSTAISWHWLFKRLLYLISWRAAETVLCWGGDRQRGETSGKTQTSPQLPKAENFQIQKANIIEKLILQPQGFFFLHSDITWDLPRPGLHFCFPAMTLVFFCLENWIKLPWQAPIPIFHGINCVLWGMFTRWTTQTSAEVRSREKSPYGLTRVDGKMCPSSEQCLLQLI